MKKTCIVSVLLMLLMLVTVTYVSASEQPMNITISDVTAEAGDTVTVNISVDNNKRISSIKLNVAYPDILTLTAVEYGTEMGGQYILPQGYDSPVTLNWVSPLENVTVESFVFAKLTFKISDQAKPSEQANIQVSYDPEDIFELNEDNVDCNVINGTVKVKSNVFGDTDGDGVLTNSDLTMLIRELSGINEPDVNGTFDVNSDGKVNNRDAIAIIQKLAGWN